MCPSRSVSGGLKIQHEILCIYCESGLIISDGAGPGVNRKRKAREALDKYEADNSEFKQGYK